MRIDLALEFLLSGLNTSSVGESTGDIGWSIVLPSGIVCGGETVVLLVKLPVLFSSPPVSTGDEIMSLLDDIVDADVRDATMGTSGLSAILAPV